MEIEDELLNEGCSQSSLSGIQIDDSLEDRLRVHGISKRNVRSMIYEVFSNENVLKLLNSKDSELELNLPDIRRTRSKKSRIENDSSGQQSCEGMAEDFANSSRPERSDDALACFLNSESMIPVDEESQLDCDLQSFRGNDDTCQEPGEFDWKSWLAELTHNETQKSSNCVGDYDSDEDPDFNFLAELEEPDLEDFRNDSATRISKKELINLQKEDDFVNNIRSSRFQEDLVTLKENVNTTKKVSKKTSKESAIKVYLRCKTAREKLELLKHRSLLRNLVKNKPKMREKPVYFFSEQREQLMQQIQQHVQLLVQTCILTHGNVNMCYEYTNCISYLQELEYFGYGCGVNQSSFQVPNLKDAITLVSSLELRNLQQPGTDNEVNYLSHEQVDIICNSEVLVYRELLPNFENSLVSNTQDRKFSLSEDCLIAYGLAGMSGFFVPVFDLISAYVLPVFTSQQIKERIQCVIRCGSHKDLSNPILKYKSFGVLPGACEKVKPVNLNESKKPLDMYGELPTYVEKYRLWKECKDESSSNKSFAITNLFHDQERNTIVSAKNIKMKRSGSIKMVWTKTLDEIVLTTCKKHNGLSGKAFAELETVLKCSKTAIKQRFNELMKIYQKMNSS